MGRKKAYTDEQLAFICELVNDGLNFDKITKKFNKKYKTEKNVASIRQQHAMYSGMFDLEDNDTSKRTLKQIQQTKRKNSYLAKENRTILDFENSLENVVIAVQDTISMLNVVKEPTKVVKKSKKQLQKRPATMELMLSDLHFGKKTDKFNRDVARDRMRQLVDVKILEYHRMERDFNVERLIVAMIGDMIESYTMHGLESATSSEMGNSEQIMLCIDSLFYDCLVPLAKLGIKIDVPAVTGNHDRTEKNRTMNKVGKNNVTWIIYHALERLCKEAGMSNIKFHIAEGPYITLDIYGNTVLYEHGDNFPKDRKGIEAKIAARSRQINKMIDFLRMGHYHEVTMYDQGRIIINGCLPGQDSYADVLGFNTQAFQVLNFYVKTKERPTCFYKSFPIYLK